MKECGRATRGVSRAKVLIRQSVIPCGSSPVAINLQFKSPQAYVIGDCITTLFIDVQYFVNNMELI